MTKEQLEDVLQCLNHGYDAIENCNSDILAYAHAIQLVETEIASKCTNVPMRGYDAIPKLPAQAPEDPLNIRLGKLVNSLNLLDDAKDIGTYAGRLAGFFCAVENIIQMPPTAHEQVRDMSRFDEEPDADIHGECCNEINKLHAALRDLVNQIRKCDPVDDNGHKMTMNMAYLKAVEVLGAYNQDDTQPDPVRHS